MMKVQIMQDLKTRTKCFAINCWQLCKGFPQSTAYNAYVNQLICSSSSVGANYRAESRAKSDKDFLNKLKIVEEEANKLLAITVSSIKTVRRRLN